MSFNLAVMLTESAKARPDHPVAAGLTYAQLERGSAAFAAGMLAQGFGRGERVAVLLANTPEFLIVYFGLLRAGLVMVPLNPQLTARELRHVLSNCAAAAVITLPDCLDPVGVAAPGLPIYMPGQLPTGEPAAECADTKADDTALIIYTSGTSGSPKGPQLSHFGLYQNATIAGQTFGVQPDDVTLAALPFFHIYGLSGVVNVAVRYGTTLCVLPRFETEAVLDAMAGARVSVIVGVPTMYHALLHADLRNRDLSALRIGACGGSSMPEALMSAFEQRFGITILEGYGMSETGSAAMMNPSRAERKVGSVGKPIWGTTARIADVAGNVLGANEIGEILLRGHHIMNGYHNDPTSTAEAIRRGWLHTGDLGYRDTDGFYYIVDRLKDLIIRGGYNVYPREVEEVLYTHPGIGEAAVIGQPDERLGEEVVAVVAPKPGHALGVDVVLAFCRERLAAYKCPREIRFVDALPKNTTGKVLKTRLRAALEKPHA
jgi:long-chain acyl-CoA synthetase